MTSLIEQYGISEQLKNIAQELELDASAYNEYLRFANNAILELENDDPEGMEEFVVDYSTKYIKIYSEQIKAGFSIEWSKSLANSNWTKMEKNSAANAYYTIKEIDKIRAANDLKLYCKLKEFDELFTKHFISLINDNKGTFNLSAEEQAAEYSKIYKRQIDEGKSEIFAHKYADLMASDEYCELACYVEAIEYEKAINAGYSESYAFLVSNDLSEYVANKYDTYEQSLNDVFMDRKREKIEKEYEHLKFR